ncbi:MAG: hypothetical protein QXG39_04905 [Candidatus Aenigmatarchaeota archaeon]
MEEMSEEKLKEVLEKISEKITEERITVYHQVNNKVRIDNPLRELVEVAVTNRSPDFTYTSGKSSYGEMIARVYIFGNIAIICEQWQPNFGYSWDERRITLIKLKSPSD